MIGLLIMLFFQTSIERSKIDVAPISVEYGEPVFTYCDLGCFDVPANGQTADPFGTKPHRRTHLTCEDKTRFLMTAEDNSSHCIKLENPGLRVN